MNIHICVIPESEQRKCVSGADWFFDSNGDLQVRISPLSNWRRECLLGLHEAIEAVICRHRGIPHEAVDKFDLEYESTHTSDLNAGDDPLAPYVREHCLATGIERILCVALDTSWLDYDKELENKYPGPTKK